ncbi:TetR/AcrR family transcriptional regulator [Hyphococcus sp.]|uniref:TetR/AcrR family transcriptional regulator n=1 Tax=Hyphococcus sp. TaxID=2038636 RepID=UPI003D13A614
MLALTRLKRKRRTPEQAREEILLAAEALILEQGPSELKFQALADRANVAVSNVYHHFGGVLEIKRGLAEKVFDELTQDLIEALSEEEQNEPLAFAQNVMYRLYSVLRSERYAKLIGWIVLSTELGDLERFLHPLPGMTAVVSEHLARHLPPELANRLAAAITYNLSITAIGEGLIGPAVKAALSMDDDSADGSRWLGNYWKQLLDHELEEVVSRRQSQP